MKRSFTLVEVLTSLVLGVLLVSSLVQLLAFSRKKEEVSRNMSGKAIEWLIAKERLEESLGLAEVALLPKEKSIEGGAGLFFTFDNGIDIDPDFCGRRKARLTAETSGLFLTIYGEKKERREALLATKTPPSFFLWDGQEPKSVTSALVDKRVRAVIIDAEERRFIIHLCHAPILEID